MNRLTSTLVTAVLTVTVSSPVLAGTIVGARTSRTGTIVGARTGNIVGARTGNIAGTSTATRRDDTEARSRFNALLSENIPSIIRLLLESSIF